MEVGIKDHPEESSVLSSNFLGKLKSQILFGRVFLGNNAEKFWKETNKSNNLVWKAPLLDDKNGKQKVKIQTDQMKQNIFCRLFCLGDSL